MKIFGFLRETTEKAIVAGINKEFNIGRTGLDEYLKVIFPETTDWIYDKALGELPDGTKSRKRPDYRSESLKLIVEFDGTQHYQSPQQIIRDMNNTSFYESLGYKVVRIPYFIQLTNEVVEILFNKKIEQPLFDETIPSFSSDCSPAMMCPAGIRRAAYELIQFPQQYYINIDHLFSLDNDFITGASLLYKEVDSILHDDTLDFNNLFIDEFRDILEYIYELAKNYCDDCKDDLYSGQILIEQFYPMPLKDFHDMLEYFGKINISDISKEVLNILCIAFNDKVKRHLVEYNLI